MPRLFDLAYGRGATVAKMLRRCCAPDDSRDMHPRTSDVKAGTLNIMTTKEAGSVAKTVGIIHTWPDLKNAEYEVLQRILLAAKNCGILVVVIDDNSTVLWSAPELNLVQGKPLHRGVVDYVISLHYQSARLVDEYSYITLWNPIEFYHIFGYQKSIDNLSSHNDLISCASDIADAHGVNIMAGVGRSPVMPLPHMFHTPAGPYLAPRTNDTSTLFYIGINWERVGGQSGRFHETMMMLDEKGLLDIYGPEKIMGVAPWEGFASYRGELPFDGESIKYAINRSGICLALSSPSHKNAGIMSNRLFEGLAGGAAVIASPNALIDKFFSDVVYVVDDTHGEQVLGQQITETVRRIRGDPDEARRRTLKGQEILERHCSLERSLNRLRDETPARIAHHERTNLADAEVTVILSHRGTSLKPLRTWIDQLICQKRSRLYVHLLCDRTLATAEGDEIAALATRAVASITVHPIDFNPTGPVFDGPIPMRQRTGPVVGKILEKVNTATFAFLDTGDALFCEHFASLAKALENEKTASFAAAGMISEVIDTSGALKRSIHSARFIDFNSILLVNGERQIGRFLFRRELIDNDNLNIFTILDGEESSYFRLKGFLAGPLAQSNYATYVLSETDVMADIIRAEPVEHQRQFIRDAFTHDPRWLDRLSRGTDLPQFVYAYGPGTPIRWMDNVAPAYTTRRLAPNVPMRTIENGAGLKYLADGFSTPEPHLTWISGERGILEFSVAANPPVSNADYVLILSMSGRRSAATGREQHCTIIVNGKVIAYLRVPETETDLQIAVPVINMMAPTAFRVEIVPDHHEPVYDESGVIIDDRRLSVSLKYFELRERTMPRPPKLDIDTIYSCGEGGSGEDALVEGFYPPEKGFSWIAGCKAIIRFRAGPLTSRSVLTLLVSGRQSLETGELPHLSVTVNGVHRGNYPVSVSQSTVLVPLDDIDFDAGVLFIHLKASAAEAVFDEHHLVIDERLLGIAVHAVGVLSKMPKQESVENNDGQTVEDDSAGDVKC